MAMNVLDNTGLTYFKSKIMDEITQAVAPKANTSDIPTAVSDLTNDLQFQTATEVQSAINEAIGDVSTISIQVVEDLPGSGAANTIYLVPKEGGGSSQNVYDEYLWQENKWEKIGDTAVDLTGYATQEWVTGQLASYVTSTALTSQLANYVTSESLTATLGNYVTSSSLTGTLSGYLKTTDMVAITNGEIDDMFTA